MTQHVLARSAEQNIEHRRSFRYAFFPALGVLLVLLLGELGLRLAPTVIPPALVQRFQYDIQLQIEAGQTLFQHDKLIEVQRDDGGPSLQVFAPNIVIQERLRAVDRKFGGLEAATTDETGFCNPPTHRWRSEAVELVAIGDSMTWCTAVAPDEAWPAQLETLTDRATYNLGRGGIGIFEELQLLKAYGLPRNPKVVLLNVYEGNDVRDAVRYWRARALTEPSAEHPPLPTIEQLGETRDEPTMLPWWKRFGRKLVEGTPLGQSYVVNLGLGVYRFAVENWLRGPIRAEADFRADVLINGSTLEFNRANRVQDLRTARAVSEGYLSPSLLDAGLRSFAALSKDAGFRPVVVYTPSAYTAYEGRITFRAPGVADLMHRFSDKQRRWLRDATRRYGLEYLDLTPVMQRAAAISPEPLYFPQNLHFTAAGHRVVATALADALRRPPASEVGAKVSGLNAGAAAIAAGGSR